MKDKEVTRIYERLLAINFTVEAEPVLEPRYLNEKIGELHSYINEVEEFAIKTHKELSVYERAVNNAEAKYEEEKERLITEDDEIKTLPNIKDREAKANSRLKKEIQEIKNQRNELSDLNNLLKAISLKMRNLSRANTDIRMQIRIMESQLKLGTYKGDPTTIRGIEEEMKKSMEGTDSFEHAETKAEQNMTADPSSNLIDDMFGEPEEQQEEEQEQESEVPENLLDPFPEPGTDADSTAEDIIKEAEKEIEEEKPIDLDTMIDPEHQTPEPEPEPETDSEKGGESAQSEETNSKNINSKNTESDKIDVEDLLAQFN